MLLSNSFILLLLRNASEGVIFPSHFWEPEILRREQWRTWTRFAELGADWLLSFDHLDCWTLIGPSRISNERRSPGMQITVEKHFLEKYFNEHIIHYGHIVC